MKRKTDKKSVSQPYPMEIIPPLIAGPDPVEYNGKIEEPIPPTIIYEN